MTKQRCVWHTIRNLLRLLFLILFGRLQERLNAFSVCTSHVARRHSVTAALATASLALCTLVATSHAARAQYLINPAGGTLLFSGNQPNAFNGTSFTNDVDDNTVNRTLGFNFSFFGGAPTNAVYVSTNGNINFTGDTAFNNAAFPTSIARIAPLWSDLYIYGNTNANISEISNANYYAVTWNVNTFNQPQNVTNRQRFQAVLFGATTTIGNRTFNTGDIAFSYNTLDQLFANNKATIGLDKGDNTAFAVAPNAPAGGLYSSAQATSGPTAVPLFPSTNNILLFSQNGATYTSSIVNVTAGSVGPEPGSLALLGTGVVPMVGIVVRRRRAAKKAA